MPDSHSTLSQLRGKRLARAAKAAAHLDISRSTLWHWAKTRPGFPQPMKVGDRVTLFDLDAIDAYVVGIAGGAAS